MFYKTKRKRGLALQYLGDNIKEFEETFPSLKFKRLNSVTTWSGELFSDYRVFSNQGDEDLIVGDWVMDEGAEWYVVPMEEFDQYWEEE